MRLSEAIALGRTIKPAMPGSVGIWSLDSPGCAIGMAQAAVNSLNTSIYDLWPWVANHRSALPCGCSSADGYSDGANGTVAHLFDQHVFGKCDWTLDQLIDWVRSVEPAEDAPSSNEALAKSDAHAEVVEKSF